MTRFALLLLAAAPALLAQLPGTVKANADGDTQKLPPDPARDRRLAWWKEARFGMFIHWGLYALPAGEWKGQPIAGIGEWIMNRARIPIKEYEPLAARFNPVKFDADEWVRLAKAAGQRYIVITSKHHDGFAMFASKASPYNIVDATPFRRDPMKELAAACQREGIRLCFYYSQAQDWHHPGGAGNNWDFPDESKKDFDGYLETLVKPHVKELLTQYGPIGLIWFDTPVRIRKEQSESLRDLVHQLRPDTIVSGRIGHDVGDYRSMPDNQIPVKVLDFEWETPVTLNDTWGFKKDDHDWKSPQTLIRQLVDVVSKNGNYLLNVGPTAEGVIPAPSVERLMTVGKWMQTNGEAIYGASGSPFGYEFEWGAVTAKPGKLYLHIVDWPKSGEFVLRGLRAKVNKATLLAAPGAPVAVKRGKTAGIDEIRLTLPAAPPDPVVSVVALDLAGEPRIAPGLVQQPDGKLTLSSAFATRIPGSKLRLDNRGIAVNWLDTDETLRWTATAVQPGTYEVVLSTTEARTAFSRTDWVGDHRVEVTAAGQKLDARITESGRVADPRNPLWRDVRSVVGRVKIAKAGPVEVVVRPVEINKERKLGLRLRNVQLVPAS